MKSLFWLRKQQRPTKYGTYGDRFGKRIIFTEFKTGFIVHGKLASSPKRSVRQHFSCDYIIYQIESLILIDETEDWPAFIYTSAARSC